MPPPLRGREGGKALKGRQERRKEKGWKAFYGPERSPNITSSCRTEAVKIDFMYVFLTRRSFFFKQCVREYFINTNCGLNDVEVLRNSPLVLSQKPRILHGLMTLLAMPVCLYFYFFVDGLSFLAGRQQDIVAA